MPLRLTIGPPQGKGAFMNALLVSQYAVAFVLS